MSNDIIGVQSRTHKLKLPLLLYWNVRLNMLFIPDGLNDMAFISTTVGFMFIAASSLSYVSR